MHKSTFERKLPGAVNEPARELYRLLEKHYHHAVCKQCAFYKQYGVMIIKGDFAEHLQDIGGDWQAVSELDKLVKAQIIELDKISAHQYRVAFVHVQAEKTEKVEAIA